MPKRRKLAARPTQHRPPKPPQSKPKTKPDSKSGQKESQHDATIPFEAEDRILLIGEGDLSFAASLIQHHACTRVTATVLDKDYAQLLAKYPFVDANIAVIDDRSVEDDQDVTNRLVYSVDANKPFPASVARGLYDHVVFNFPHVGGKSTDVNRQVRHNQQLLVSFFQRVLGGASSSSIGGGGRGVLAPGGDVIVTLFEAEPYTLWNIRDLARHAGLQVQRSFRFLPSAYPGYRHARTFGVVRSKSNALGKEEATSDAWGAKGSKDAGGGGWRGEDRPARSYVFVRKGDVPAQTSSKKRKKDDSSDSEDE